MSREPSDKPITLVLSDGRRLHTRATEFTISHGHLTAWDGDSSIWSYELEDIERIILGHPRKSYTVESKRADHPRAYQRWTEDDDRQLENHHREGRSVEQLAAELHRKPSAIQSRLVKLGLLAGAQSMPEELSSPRPQ